MFLRNSKPGNKKEGKMDCLGVALLVSLILCTWPGLESSNSNWSSPSPELYSTADPCLWLIEWLTEIATFMEGSSKRTFIASNIFNSAAIATFHTKLLVRR